MDDFSNNINTTGLLEIDGATVTGIHETTSDDDWFRMELERYYTYELLIEPNRNSGPPQSNSFTRVMDRNGTEDIRYFGSSLPRTIFYQAEYSGSHFVSLFNGTHPYKITLKSVADDYDSPLRNNFITHSEIQYGVIETTGDEDPHTVQLLKGNTYTINVYGSDTSDATLANPFLQVLDKHGTLIGEDDNSGIGNNASFTFSPNRTDFYDFNIFSADGGTGSYILDIPELDDYPEDNSTTGTITIGDVSSSGSIFWNDEADWFRVSLDQYHSYEFKTAEDPTSVRPTTPLLQILDVQGRLLQTGSGFPRSREVFQAQYSGDYFVRVFGGGAGGYLVSGTVVDDHPYLAAAKYTLDRRIIGAIESASDNDSFRLGLAGGVRYEINVVGRDVGGYTLEDPQLQLYSDSLEWMNTDNDSGGGKNAKLVFTPLEDGLFRFRVLGNNGSTGSYAFTVRAADDFSSDRKTTSKLQFTDGAASTQGIMEFGDDVDWHRADLIEDQWYQVQTTASQLIVRDGDRQLVGQSKGGRPFVFQAKSSEEHYFVTRLEPLYGLIPQSYDLNLELVHPRMIAAPRRLMPLDSRFVASTIHTNVESEEDVFEVYSTNRLQLRNQTFAPRQLIQVHRRDFERLTVPDHFRGNSQVFVRFKPVNSSWTNWDSSSVYGTLVDPTVQGRSVPNTIYYSFAEELPGYYNGNATFEGALSADEQEIFRTAIRYWDEPLRINFVERPANELTGLANEMAVFKSNVEITHVYGKPPGINSGLDLRIKSDSPVMQAAWNEGGEAFYEILRGIGGALGLSASSQLNRRESIMGLRTDPETWFMPYPSQPLPLDTLAVQPSAGIFAAGNDGDTVYAMSGDPFARTIVDSSGNDTIDASGQPFTQHIDLRPGATSHSGSPNSRRYSYVNSYYAELENAIGGIYRDVLIGSNLRIRNRLEGRNGNDILTGMQGDDLLMGGRHSDTYAFQLGHDHDTIDEQGLGGLDRIYIEGMHNFDQLQDMQFRKLNGTDLVIRLDLDGAGDSRADTITIRNMNAIGSRVERLDLTSPSGELLMRASLKSVFQQATSSFQRFELVNGFDNFGQLTQPIG